MRNSIVACEAGKFCSWPASKGLWRWDAGREILVGFSFGGFVDQEGQNIKGRNDTASGVVSPLARSRDGSRTWTVEDPENFVGDGAVVSDAPGEFDVEAPGFALRDVGMGCHGSQDPLGLFFVFKLLHIEGQRASLEGFEPGRLHRHLRKHRDIT